MSKYKALLFFTILGLSGIFIIDYIMYNLIQEQYLRVYIHRSIGIILLICTGTFLYLYLSKMEQFSELTEEQMRLHALIDTMGDFVNFKDGKGNWIKVNEFGLKLFHLEHVDYKGKTDSELAVYTHTSSGALEYCEMSDEATWNSKKVTRCQEVIQLTDGTHRIFDTTKIPLFEQDGSRKSLIVIGRDVTDIIRAQNELSVSQQQYKSLYEYNPDPLFMLDLQGLISDVNSRFEAIIGESEVNLVGVSIFDFIIQSPADQLNLKKSFADVIHSKKGIHKGDLRFQTKTGKFWLSCTIVPILINGTISGVICYAKDVTHLRETEKMLRKAEKLSIVGELAASVAHEIRNPLTSIKGFIQLLKDDSNTREDYFNIMLNELDRINLIVSELLVLAKPQELQLTQQNLHQLMTEVVVLLEPQAHFSGTELNISSNPQLPTISCEANQLKQVFINIIKNSIEARATKINVEFILNNSSVLVKITDDGLGITQSRIKHLGEPFYSSKEKGTGLGLTITYRIIEAHKGSVHIHSEIEKGTTVEITLPID